MEVTIHGRHGDTTIDVDGWIAESGKIYIRNPNGSGEFEYAYYPSMRGYSYMNCLPEYCSEEQAKLDAPKEEERGYRINIKIFPLVPAGEVVERDIITDAAGNMLLSTEEKKGLIESLGVRYKEDMDVRELIKQVRTLRNTELVKEKAQLEVLISEELRERSGQLQHFSEEDISSSLPERREQLKYLVETLELNRIEISHYPINILIHVEQQQADKEEAISHGTS